MTGKRIIVKRTLTQREKTHTAIDRLLDEIEQTRQTGSVSLVFDTNEGGVRNIRAEIGYSNFFDMFFEDKK